MNGLDDMTLPVGWAWSTLEEILAAEPGAITDGPFGSNLKSAHYTDNGARVLRLQNVGDGVFRDERAYISLEHFENLKKHEAREGDLILASLGEVLPRVTILPRLDSPAIVKADVIRARIHQSLSTKWVLYTLLSPQIRGYTASRIKGVGRPRLGLGEIRQLPIPVPPLAEQHRIIDAIEDHLSRIDAGNGYLTTAGRKSPRLQSSLYHKAVSGTFSRPVSADEVVEDEAIQRASRPLANGRWKPVDHLEIPGYTKPQNWTTASLGTLSYASGYGTSTKCAYGASGYPVLRIPNIQDGSIDLSDIKRAVDPSLNLERLSLKYGDLLFVRTNGSPSLIGRVGIATRSLPYAFASYLIRFRLTPGIVEPRWIQLVTQSPLWRREIERYAASSAGQYNLNAEILSQIQIPFPPLDVQRETLETVELALTGISHLAATCKAGSSSAENLRRSVLRQAFNGKLVPQDPTDEPASALLERIRRERSAQAARRSRRPRKAAVTKDASLPPPPSTPTPTIAVQQELPL